MLSAEVNTTFETIDWMMFRYLFEDARNEEQGTENSPMCRVGIGLLLKNSTLLHAAKYSLNLQDDLTKMSMKEQKTLTGRSRKLSQRLASTNI